jgi:hypothetical protein
MPSSFERIPPSETNHEEPISEQRIMVREQLRPVEAARDVARIQEEALRRDLSSLDHLDLGAKITAALGLGAHFASTVMDTLPEFKSQFGLTDEVVHQVSDRGIAVAAFAVTFSLVSSGLKASLKRRTTFSGSKD